MRQTVNILIVEDSKIFAQGIQLLLEQHPRVKETTIANNYKGALDILKEKIIHIVILDLNFETNEYSGFTIAKKVKQLYPKIKIMILTQHTRISHYNILFEQYNVDAYLDKQLGVEETFTAIDQLIKNERYVDKNIEQMLEIKDWMKASKREEEILELLRQGYIQKEIADKLYIAQKTVETHIRNLFYKFKVKNSTELIAKYIRYKSANRENGEDLELL